MLSVRAITKSYGWFRAPAVEDVSLDVAPGEVVGLVGLNGAGKTTTLRVAGGVMLMDAGSVEVDGADLTGDKPAASRRLGWVPEQAVHDPGARLSTLLRYYSDIAGGVPYSVGDRALSEWGLDEYRSRRFRSLSLGLKRRFSIAVASLLEPRYYLLDEPFNGLDPLALAHVREWIVASKAAGTGLLLSSHNLPEVQSLCERVVVIDRGHIIASVRAAEIGASATRGVTVDLEAIDAGAVAILERFGTVKVAGGTATVRGAGIDSVAVNAALVQGGYRVRKLAPEEPSLEEYFLRQIGEGA
jgi:ABC-2 type transport system ATP-binding protein